MSVMNLQQAIDQMLELIKVEAKKSVEEYKARSKEFKSEISKIIAQGFETPLTSIIAFLMQYSPRGLTPAVTYILNDISGIEKLMLDTDRKILEKRNYPYLYPDDLKVLRTRMNGLTTVFNKKVMALMGRCNVSARYNASIWGILQEAEYTSYDSLGNRQNRAFMPQLGNAMGVPNDTELYGEDYEDFEEGYEEVDEIENEQALEMESEEEDEDMKFAIMDDEGYD